MSRGTGRAGARHGQTLPASACPGIDGGGEVRMPRTTELGKIPAVDLAYAVSRLIQEGKTTLLEVRRFAEERPARIAALERELATLKAGHAAAKALNRPVDHRDRKSTRLNSSHLVISYAVFCLKKKKKSKE